MLRVFVIKLPERESKTLETKCTRTIADDEFDIGHSSTEQLITTAHASLGPASPITSESVIAHSLDLPTTLVNNGSRLKYEDFSASIRGDLSRYSNAPIPSGIFHSCIREAFEIERKRLKHRLSGNERILLGEDILRAFPQMSYTNSQSKKDRVSKSRLELRTALTRRRNNMESNERSNTKRKSRSLLKKIGTLSPILSTHTSTPSVSPSKVNVAQNSLSIVQDRGTQCSSSTSLTLSASNITSFNSRTRAILTATGRENGKRQPNLNIGRPVSNSITQSASRLISNIPGNNVSIACCSNNSANLTINKAPRNCHLPSPRVTSTCSNDSSTVKQKSSLCPGIFYSSNVNSASTCTSTITDLSNSINTIPPSTMCRQIQKDIISQHLFSDSFVGSEENSVISENHSNTNNVDSIPSSRPISNPIELNSMLHNVISFILVIFTIFFILEFYIH